MNFFEALYLLNEDTNNTDIEALKSELANLKAQYSKLAEERKVLINQIKEIEPIKGNSSSEVQRLIAEKNTIADEGHKLWKRIREIKDILYSTKTNIIADEEDWERYFNSKLFPNELNFNDLGIEVEGEFGGEPIADSMPMWYPISYSKEKTLRGILNNYTYYLDNYSVEDLQKLIAKYLNRPIKEITKKELFEINYDKLESWLKDVFQDDAVKEATKRWEQNDIDYDQIDWEEDSEE